MALDFKTQTIRAPRRTNQIEKIHGECRAIGDSVLHLTGQLVGRISRKIQRTIKKPEKITQCFRFYGVHSARIRRYASHARYVFAWTTAHTSLALGAGAPRARYVFAWNLRLRCPPACGESRASPLSMAKTALLRFTWFPHSSVYVGVMHTRKGKAY